MSDRDAHRLSGMFWALKGAGEVDVLGVLENIRSCLWREWEGGGVVFICWNRCKHCGEHVGGPYLATTENKADLR